MFFAFMYDIWKFWWTKNHLLSLFLLRNRFDLNFGSYRFPRRYVTSTWMQSSSTYASLRLFLSTDQTWTEELTTSLFRPQKMELRLIDAAWLSNLLVGLLCSLKYYSNKENIHNTYYTIIWRDFLTSQEILSILLISSLGLKKI